VSNKDINELRADIVVLNDRLTQLRDAQCYFNDLVLGKLQAKCPAITTVTKPSDKQVDYSEQLRKSIKHAKRSKR
jgi:hypothetical protein